MAATKYTYSISDSTANGVVNANRVSNEIRASEITIALDYINTSGDDLDIWFKNAITSEEESTLETLIQAHEGEPTSSEYTVIAGSAGYCLQTLQKDISLPKDTWTEVYSCDGEGFFWGFFFDASSTNIDIKVVVDNDYPIIDEFPLDILSGFSNISNNMPLVHLGNSNFLFSPKVKIKVNLSLKIYLKTSDTSKVAKKMNHGYVFGERIL